MCGIQEVKKVTDFIISLNNNLPNRLIIAITWIYADLLNGAIISIIGLYEWWLLYA